jgi:hypothetical protein
MGYLFLLPALLLPVLSVGFWIVRSRQPGGGEALRRNGRYMRNRLILGGLFAILAFFFGVRR